MTTLQISITIDRDLCKNNCQRDIEILPESTLSELAEAIVEAFGFDFDHAFGFYSDLEHNYFNSEEKYELFADMDEEDAIDPYSLRGGKPQSVLKTHIGDVFVKTGKKMQFIFDYGDEWRFLIELTNIGKKMPQTKYPILIQSSGEAPLQYPTDEDWEEEYA